VDTPFIVPVVMFVMLGLTFILRGPLGHAIAERIRGGSLPDPRLREEVEALRSDVDDLRFQLSEAHERIDFAERLLARRNETAPIEGAKE
jgi:hypothetical protein